MDSDFFTDGYASSKELEQIEERLVELRQELTHGFEHASGRHDKDIEEEIATLLEKKRELLEKIGNEDAAE